MRRRACHRRGIDDYRCWQQLSPIPVSMHLYILHGPICTVANVYILDFDKKHIIFYALHEQFKVKCEIKDCRKHGVADDNNDSDDYDENLRAMSSSWRAQFLFWTIECNLHDKRKTWLDFGRVILKSFFDFSAREPDPSPKMNEENWVMGPERILETRSPRILSERIWSFAHCLAMISGQRMRWLLRGAVRTCYTSECILEQVHSSAVTEYSCSSII